MSKKYDWDLLSPTAQQRLFSNLQRIQKAWDDLDETVNDVFSELDDITSDLDQKGNEESTLAELLSTLRGHIEGIECAFDFTETMDRAEAESFRVWFDGMLGLK